jgi:hypothetical protein
MLLINWKWKKLIFPFLVFFTLLVSIYFTKEKNTDLLSYIIFPFFMFAVALAITRKKDILPIITEKILLSYSLTFWFVFFSKFYKAPNFLFFLLLTPSIATILINFINSKLNFWKRIFFYYWFLLIIVFIGLNNFSYEYLNIFFNNTNLNFYSPINYILTGMAFLYLGVNVTYVFALIPLPGKHQSWADRMKEWHELTDVMTKRWSDIQSTPKQALLIIFFQGGGLFLNYHYHFLSERLVLNLLVLLPAVLSLEKNSTLKIPINLL